MHEALREYGLTEKEGEIFIILLKLGNTRLKEILSKTNLPRSTLYNTLNYLSTRGLVSKTIRDGIMHFEAVNPKKLILDIERKKNLIEKALPEFENIRNVIKESSNVEIYEIIKKNIQLPIDTDEIKNDLLIFGSYSKWEKFLAYEPNHFRNLRMKEKIKARAVIGNFDTKDFHKKIYQKITEMRFNKILDNFPCLFFIYGDKVNILTFSENIVFMTIKNKETAAAMRMIFEFFWKNSAKNS